ncbi:MAG: 3-phosphoshikimate 1-carboxyvinyltransferase [Oscillospiraceae bacterium]|nr:3-phosphoshikimate 1-carboxyvinyltransferase [Oscillospiraceae bacterium]
MTVTIRPGTPVGTVEAPPSKSMAHRLLLCAGLAAGESRISGVRYSEDVAATLDCLRALGAEWRQHGETLFVTGADPRRFDGASPLPCRESGSTLRFFLPLCLLSGAPARLTCAGRLPERPMRVYEDLCRARGLDYAQSGAEIRVRGPLRPGCFSLPGDVSSQFVSGLLFALPLLDGDSEIALTGSVESRSYIELTLAALRGFGLRAGWAGARTLHVSGNQRYAPRDLRVEGDWSNAAFFRALDVPVTGLDPESLQGDRVCETYFTRIRRSEICDLRDCPDLGPVLFAYAAMHGGGRFTGTARLRLKESDRAAAMAAELSKFCVETALEDNAFTVLPGRLSAPREALDGHNDHRIVMALSVLCTRVGGRIRGAEAVRKSFPDFFDRLGGLGIEVIKDEMDQ